MAFKAAGHGLALSSAHSCAASRALFSWRAWSGSPHAQHSGASGATRRCRPRPSWTRASPPPHRLHDCGQVPSCLSLGFLICRGGTLSRILKRCWEAWTSQRSRSAGLEAGLGGHTIGHSPHHPSPSHKPALPLSSPAPFSPAPRGPGSFSLSPHPVPYRIPWPCDTAGAGLRVWCRRGGLIQQGLPPSPPRRTGSCTPTGSCDVSCQ